MKNDTLPAPYENVMVTYEKTIYRGPYGDTHVKEIVTKRGFYCKLFNTFSIPPDWRYFNGVLLPHGFGGDHLPPDEIIEWKPIE